MNIETYIIEGSREFGQDFPLPALTVTGKAQEYRTARQDAYFQALDIWRADDEGWWNGGYHGCGNIQTEMMKISNA